ncbi:SMI1/KNR4 family protein [Aeoliella sp. SH292]|uniref:SMI1/KNR4 family protein n=1 Tax=Aeoliella sp. SH292 TaxID=3454464 RepID=UPI003F9E7017
MSRLADAWNALEQEVLKRISEAKAASTPPAPRADITLAEGIYGRSYPIELKELYHIHNGYNVSGYLPSRFSASRACEFGVMPAKEAAEIWQLYMEQSPSARAIFWLPSVVRTILSEFFYPASEQLWNPKWIPFAENGAGDVLFVDTSRRNRVGEYSHETRETRFVARSLSKYFLDTAEKMAKGKIQPFNVS